MILPHYEVHKGDGPPLLMVHGILSSRAQWLPNLNVLRSVSTPIVLELFGHGRSPSPVDHKLYHPDYYIEAFEEIRCRLGVVRWHVMGYSLGAGLTIRYCLEKPETIISQMFTNSTSAFAKSEATKKVRDKGNEIISQYESGGRKAIESIPVHPKNAKRIPAEIKTVLLQDCELLNPMGVARTIVHTNGNSSIRDIAHENSVPALLLCGVKEKRFTEFRNFAVEQMTCLEVVDLPAGHAVNIEASTEFNKAVIDFLTDDGKPNQLHAGDSE
jgi:2-succinyl-6-hydroxy-2,4-cyclohexadiene-1-carboxylate synthase|tara:strand:- start:11423 stop:12235 length:813 start_codon:yes stop_codon:yes gene_type:complete